MAQQLVTTKISKEQSIAALELIAQFNQLMNGLVTLTPGKRRSLAMMGPKSDRYVRGVVLSLSQNAEIVPKVVDVASAAGKLESIDNLLPVLKAWQQSLERIQDTVAALGSDAMVVANQGFKLMKSLGKHLGLEEITQELSYRHSKSRRKKPPIEDVPNKSDSED